jgi:hypothetical protein
MGSYDHADRMTGGCDIEKEFRLSLFPRAQKPPQDF